jgi:hypothetical protein
MNDERPRQPAFPNPRWEGWGSPQEGMSLRDYFAAKALPLAMEQYRMIINCTKEPIPSWEKDKCLSFVAADAYRLADAMLEERKQ